MRGLLYTCSARFGSSIVAVLGSFQVLWGTPIELHWGTCSSKVEVGPPLEFFFVWILSSSSSLMVMGGNVQGCFCLVSMCVWPNYLWHEAPL